jgi:biopolymer transport protein ExbB
MWYLLAEGGIIMIPLAFCSLLGLVIISERILYYFLQNRTSDSALQEIKLVLYQGKLDEAKYLAASWRTSLGRIIESVIKQWQKDKRFVEETAQNAGELGIKRFAAGT